MWGYNPTPKKICYETFTTYGVGKDPHRVVAPVKKKKGPTEVNFLSYPFHLRKETEPVFET